MTVVLARSLLAAGVVSRDALAQALLVSMESGTSLVRALLATRAVDARALERQLAQGQVPFWPQVTARPSFRSRLPRGLCERLLAVPVQRDPTTGVIDVAVVDPDDPHPLREVAYWLKQPVRMVRTSLAAFEAAIGREETSTPASMRALAPPMSARPPKASAPDTETILAAVASPRPSAPIVAAPLPAFDGMAEPVIALTRKKRNTSQAKDTYAVEPAHVTERGPFGAAMSAVPPALADTRAIMDRILDARDRDSVLELVVEGIRTVAGRVAVFANRREGIVGWTCTPEFADRASLRALSLPTGSAPGAATTVLSGAMTHQDARLVRVPRDAVHGPLLALMKAPPLADVAVAALRVEGKAIGVILADDLWDTEVTLRRIEDIARAAAQTLGRLLRERRKQAPGAC
ncbi:MAG: hypothetical protein M3O36_12355 [Myxococcota bacterium]|nr:hypothetical protein [Myxococcota bacterium]